MKQLLLRQQLRRAGANKDEARELARLTAHLSPGVLSLGSGQKRAIAEALGVKPQRAWRHRAFELSAGFALVTAMVIVAQGAAPGTPLYGVKRASEDVRARVQPSFRQDLVERRHSELDNLKRENAGSTAINQAEEDYHKSLEQVGRQSDSQSGSTPSGPTTSTSDKVESGSGDAQTVNDAVRNVTQTTSGSTSGGSGSTPGGSGMSTTSGSNTSGSTSHDGHSGDN